MQSERAKMMTRELRSRKVIMTSATTLNESKVKLKQTKMSEWFGSRSNANGEESLSDSVESTQRFSRSSSSDSLSKVTPMPPRRGSNRIKKLPKTRGSKGEDSSTIVLQLDKILTCDAPNCSYHTSFKNDLERHKKTKHEMKPFKCQECEYVTGNKKRFTLHVRAHAGKAPIKCQICDWATSFPSSLRSHMKQVHERAELRKNGISRASEFGKRFKCSKCDFRAVGKQEIHLPNYSHETERKHKCSFPGCDYRSKTACSLREHVKRHDVDAKKEFKCPLCSKCFWTSYSLHNHIQYHTKERTVKCSKCKYVTNYASGLKKHMRTHALKSDEGTDKPNAGESLEVLNNEQSLPTSDEDHSRPHKDLKDSGKVLESDVTKSSLELEDHRASPTMMKNLQKNPPDHEKFKKTELKAPQEFKKPKIILERKHKCDHCDFTAIYKCKIIRHAVVHRDPNDKIYSCSFPGCNFKTNWEDYIKKHKRVMHKSAPDHLCPIEGCGFETKWKDTLAQHMRIHDKKRKKSYQCPMCRKAFYDSQGLKRHINIHTQEKKYKCPLCDYVSGEGSNFYAHRRKYHPGQECEPIRSIS